MRGRKSRSYRKKTSSKRKRSYKRSARPKKFTTRKYTKSLKHSIVIGNVQTTWDQIPDVRQAISLSGSVADSIMTDGGTLIADLGRSSAMYVNVCTFLRSKHQQGQNTPLLRFSGIKIKVVKNYTATYIPVAVIESYPGQGLKSYAFTSGKTYIKCLADVDGKKVWPEKLIIVNATFLKLTYYYKLSKPGFKLPSTTNTEDQAELDPNVQDFPIKRPRLGN
ncbi:MAG: hypothetical protein KA802_16670 [Saprospiraceae bacterium]|nr:hypothetical protein [Saprospiraceae bacterium]